MRNFKIFISVIFILSIFFLLGWDQIEVKISGGFLTVLIVMTSLGYWKALELIDLFIS